MKLKNLFGVLFVATLLMGFASCSSDDDENGIVGTWTYSKVESDVETSDPDVTASIKEYFTREYSDSNNTIVFDNNGTYSSTYNEGESIEIENGTYTFKSGILSLIPTNNTEVVVGYSTTIKGNTLAIRIDRTAILQDEIAGTGSAVVVTKAIATIYYNRK